MSGGQMENILVTGAGGFIGHHLANYLSEKRYNVTGIDLHFAQEPLDGVSPNFKKLKGDFRHKELMKDLLSGMDIVFHLASAHLQISLDKSDYWDINVYSLRPFLELCQQKGVKRFVHVSSVGVYGNLNSWPANEESECHPQSIYGETKLSGEEEVKKFNDETGLPVVIIRPAWVYGAGCSRTMKIYRTLKKKRFIMIGNGENLRHPVYIKDMLEAFHLTMQKDDAVGQVIIVGGERAITTNELIKTFSKSLDVPDPIIRVPYSMGKAAAVLAEIIFSIVKKEPPISTRSLEFFNTNNSFDIGKAKAIIDYCPRYSVQEGLYDTRPWLEDNSFPSSLRE